ncbi:endonuclease/exonuclease/phosphatase family protein [Streptomyces sp. CL12-4]|uniref:endonuclease/exonuclease/phosphatase family protein n=1 Tax=Streptomyces sp. CL12-4 TaxID=2810306 RepID=UPI001EFB2166|nr:endonuclease/exonuclease/phosphatase family protein [Streptomyces sp. CL12-4]MCG8971474.1 endonuclease/exonuclease/phosphatase family protein [Streptomyces sp. CL12-4]
MSARARLIKGALAAGLFAAIAGVPAPAATAVPTAASAEASRAGAVFSNRVANFNVCNPCRVSNPSYHVDRIVNEIVKYKPQVIALEEICVGETKRIVSKLRAKGYRYYTAHGSVSRTWWGCYEAGSAYGNAILSAAPLTNKVNHRYAEGGSEPRGYVAADTTVAGKKVRVFATHLAQSGQSKVRASEISELLRTVLGHRDAIVLGDFNADPKYSEMQPMWASFRDADPACGPDQNRPPCQPTADAAPYRKKFDYIFLRKTGSFTTPSAGVHANYSDHDLVHADLRTR